MSIYRLSNILNCTQLFYIQGLITQVVFINKILLYKCIVYEIIVHGQVFVFVSDRSGDTVSLLQLSVSQHVAYRYELIASQNAEHVVYNWFNPLNSLLYVPFVIYVCSVQYTVNCIQEIEFLNKLITYNTHSGTEDSARK